LSSSPAVSLESRGAIEREREREREQEKERERESKRERERERKRKKKAPQRSSRFFALAIKNIVN
jgi:hypothetical protein